MTNPVGVDDQAPSLSWELRATVPGMHDLMQSSYRILVASSEDELSKNQGSVWDSGRVQSSQRHLSHLRWPAPLLLPELLLESASLGSSRKRLRLECSGKVDDGNPASR